MRRSTLLLWSSIALSSASLAPMFYSAGAVAADTSKSNPKAAAAEQPLHSVPEDGTDDDFPASSRLVRDLVAAHPNEDLVICVAGCNPNLDRVIYAQPADPQAKRANVAAKHDAMPVEPEPVAEDKSQPEPPATAQAPDTAKAQGETHMEPTAAEPETSNDDAAEPPTESRRDDEQSDPDQSREHHQDGESDGPSGEPTE